MKRQKKASGRNIADSERNTTKITLRLDPESAEDLRDFAEESGKSMSEIVGAAMTALYRAKLDLAEGSGLDVYNEFVTALGMTRVTPK